MMATDLKEIAERAQADWRRSADLQDIIRVLESCETGVMPTFETTFNRVDRGYLAGSEISATILRVWPSILLTAMTNAREELSAILLLFGGVYGGVPFPGKWDLGPFGDTDRPWLNVISESRLYGHVPLKWMPLPKPPATSQENHNGN